jgi:hypothetical protein
MAKKIIVKNTIENRIFTIRGQKVMIDRDLAELYGVETKRLNESVKRNIARFPAEFMFKLTDNEFIELVAICDRFKILKHSSSTPYVFNEHGIAMLSSVLKSDNAIAINIEIIKAFIRFRHYTLSHIETNEQIAELRKLLMLHIENSGNKFMEHDKAIEQIFRVLNNLIEKPKAAKKIGFSRD